MKIKCIECRDYATHLAPANWAHADRMPYCREHGPRQGTPLPRVGEGMLLALQTVWETEECTKLHVARIVGPHSSKGYGYRVVDRAIEADLIRARKYGNRYLLHTTQLGRAILGQTPLPV